MSEVKLTATGPLAGMLAQWRDRPTCPGTWVCYGHGLTASHNIECVLYLTQEDLDRGAPFYTQRVYGPIPPDAKQETAT